MSNFHASGIDFGDDIRLVNTDISNSDSFADDEEEESSLKLRERRMENLLREVEEEEKRRQSMMKLKPSSMM